MRQRTLTGLLAAVALLAGIVTVQATRPAEPGGSAPQGDPCPADIDNSGNVDVVDFLQLLASWGPCPAPQVVAMRNAVFPTEPLVIWRLWSDGLIEKNVWETTGFEGWLPFAGEFPPAPAGEHAVDFNVMPTDPVNHAPTILVMWSDGTVVYNNRDCPPSHETWCGWVSVPD